MKRTWTDSDIDKFKELYPITSSKDLVEIFGRTAKAINSKAKYLGLRKDPEFFNRREFTEREIKYLVDKYPHIRTDIIAKKFNRCLSSIYNKAHSLGLYKTKEFLESPESGIMIKGDTRGVSTRFKKGQIPPNKGKKMSSELREKCKHTFFKKGHLPGNTKKDGEITIRKNKLGTPYYHIRLSLGKWEYLHRVLWEKENGDIPKEFNVVFIDGNTMNCKIENLKLISNSELMNENTIHRYSPELQKSIRLINKIEKYETD